MTLGGIFLLFLSFSLLDVDERATLSKQFVSTTAASSSILILNGLTEYKVRVSYQIC